MYIYVQSTDSTEVYPKNNSLSFTVQLPKRLHLGAGWTVALSELYLPPVQVEGFSWTDTVPLLVCTPQCASSVVKGSHVPLLRRVVLNDQEQREGVRLHFNPLYYIPLIQDDLDNISIYLKSTSEQKLSFGDKTLYCTLHLKQDGVPFLRR